MTGEGVVVERHEAGQPLDTAWLHAPSVLSH